MRAFKTFAAAGALALGMAWAPASAATLVIDGDWQPFEFDGVGSAWSDTFDFTLTGFGELQVTDAFFSGDQFEVFVNGVSQGLTSAPNTVGVQISTDYDTAFADPQWSSASYLFGPGSYTISGLTVLSPFNGGGAAIQLLSANNPVPEPATWLMLLLGFGGIGLAIRARKAPRMKVSYA